VLTYICSTIPIISVFHFYIRSTAFHCLHLFCILEQKKTYHSPTIHSIHSRSFPHFCSTGRGGSVHSGVCLLFILGGLPPPVHFWVFYLPFHLGHFLHFWVITDTFLVLITISFYDAFIRYIHIRCSFLQISSYFHRSLSFDRYHSDAPTVHSTGISTFNSTILEVMGTFVSTWNTYHSTGDPTYCILLHFLFWRCILPPFTVPAAHKFLF